MGINQKKLNKFIRYIQIMELTASNEIPYDSDDEDIFAMIFGSLHGEVPDKTDIYVRFQIWTNVDTQKDYLIFLN